jgi:hypothetical protein
MALCFIGALFCNVSCLESRSPEISSEIDLTGPSSAMDVEDASTTETVTLPIPTNEGTNNANPYCNPSSTSVWVIPESSIITVGQNFLVEIYLKNDETSGSYMGQIRYSLSLLPDLASGDPGPVESNLTLYPGESERVGFLLHAESEGTLELVGTVGYELHALDTSWGSFTGCSSHPIEIEIMPGMVGTTAAGLEVPIHPPNTRVGIREIDDLLDAVLSGNQDVIKSKIGWTETGCTIQEGLGGPPKCRQGEAEGTSVIVLPFLGPEGHFLRHDEVDTWSVPEAKGLYAVYRVSPDAYAEPDYPAGEFALVFLHGHGVTFVTYQVYRGQIVRIDSIFGIPPEEQLFKDAQEMILAPPE